MLMNARSMKSPVEGPTPSLARTHLGIIFADVNTDLNSTEKRKSVKVCRLYCLRISLLRTKKDVAVGRKIGQKPKCMVFKRKARRKKRLNRIRINITPKTTVYSIRIKIWPKCTVYSIKTWEQYSQ